LVFVTVTESGNPFVPELLVRVVRPTFIGTAERSQIHKHFYSWVCPKMFSGFALLFYSTFELCYKASFTTSKIYVWKELCKALAGEFCGAETTHTTVFHAATLPARIADRF